MNRPYLLLLIPVGFAIGYIAGENEPAHSQSTETKLIERSDTPRQSESDRKREHYRKLFEELLEQPSSALRISSFYALPQHLTSKEMGYLYEAIYPKGWSRYHGDLPLAVAIDWVSKDSLGLANSVNYLYSQHPDLRDNFKGIFYNLGLQNALGAVQTIKAINDSSLQNLLRSEFIAGIKWQNPPLLFETRLSLLGERKALLSLSSNEYPAATKYALANSNGITEAALTLDQGFLVHLGKELPNTSILEFDTLPNYSYLLNGFILANPTIPVELQQPLFENWIPQWNMTDDLNDEEKKLLISRLANYETLVEKLFEGPFHDILSDGLNRQTTDQLLAKKNLKPSARRFLLTEAVEHYSPDEYLELLSRSGSDQRTPGIEALFANIQLSDTLPLLKELPEDWVSKKSITTVISRFANAGDAESIHAMAQHLGDIGPYLPSYGNDSQKLWSIAPELYLNSIEGLDPQQKKIHLIQIARSADESELSLILESGTFDQQTDVLVSLLQGSTHLATEILKHEKPENISCEQAKSIGKKFAYNRESEHTLEYYKNRSLEHRNEQLSLFSFLLTDRQHKIDLDKPIYQELSELSPTHDYLNRVANAFVEDSQDIKNLERLKSENPEVFMTSLTDTLSSEDFIYSLRGKAMILLRSPSLSNKERHEIHQALYAAPQS